MTLILAPAMASAPAKDHDPNLSQDWQYTIPSTAASTVFAAGYTVVGGGGGE